LFHTGIAKTNLLIHKYPSSIASGTLGWTAKTDVVGSSVAA
jgi:hypothetical protein